MFVYQAPAQNDDVSIKILRLLKQHGDVKYLFQALPTAPSSVIAEIFQDLSIAWTEELANDCLSKVINRQEELIWEALKNAGWPYGALPGILLLAIEERNLSLVQWLLKQKDFPVQESDRMAAWNCGDLDVIECFFAREEILAERDNHRFFLFSSLDKIKEYVEDYREGLQLASLVARYTQKRDLADLSIPYRIDLQQYVHDQRAYAEVCRRAVQEALRLIEQGVTALSPILDMFVSARVQLARDRMDRDAEKYAQYRTAFREKMPPLTPFGTDDGMHTRYHFVIPWIKWQDKKQTNRSECGYGYVLYYRGSKLTAVCLDTQLWLHPSDAAIFELYPHLETLHRELLEMDPSKIGFQEKLAEAYWLGCQLMLTYRGNAQYFLMWLQTIAQYHGLEPFLAKRETPQPDCLALSLPLSDFIALFPSFFENPMEKNHARTPRTGRSL